MRNFAVKFTRLLIGSFIASRFWSYMTGRKLLSLKNRSIVVTGCDSGIGRGVMKRLIGAEAAVIAFCFTEEGAQSALEAGAKLAPCLDLTDEIAVQEACQEVKSLCGNQLWGLIHNAGMVQAGFIEFQLLENYRRTMDVNFFAIVNLTQQLIPSLKATEGRIVIVSSVDGIVSLPGNAPYDASKFAVEAYADALRAELSFWNVDVSVINPSTLKTPLALGFFASQINTWEQMEQAEPDGEWKKAWSRAWLDQYVAENTQRIEQIAQDPIHAINDIYHALAATHPKMRYLSGSAAKTFFYALWKMPEHWSFAIKKSLINPPPEV